MPNTAAGNIFRNYKKLLLQATEDGLIHAADDIESTGRDAVRRWKNKPDFKDTTLRTKQRIEVTIKPKGDKKVIQIFTYVEKGTKPHIIMPKKPGTYLKFRTGYSALTLPTAKYNQGSGMSFGNWVSKAQVFHPGSKPRLFLETFMKELVPSLQVRVQQEINRVF
jgi:hypothetical protein